MIDTHTHLYFPEDFALKEENFTTCGTGSITAPAKGCCDAVERGVKEGVCKMIFPNVNLDSCGPLLALHHAYPRITCSAPGLHPSDVRSEWRVELREIMDRFSDESPVAIGEIGIDLYHDSTYRSEQMDAFGEQVQIALERSLPVIIHCREGLEETLEILESFRTDLPEMVFHSFTYGPREAERILEFNPKAFFGINGVVTFKNAPDVREAVRMIGPQRTVLETDSPYLAPVPLRGRRNESAFLPHICRQVAREWGITVDEAEAVTDRNATELFGL